MDTIIIMSINKLLTDFMPGQHMQVNNPL